MAVGDDLVGAQFRAVFSYPPTYQPPAPGEQAKVGPNPDTYGPPRATQGEAEADTPPRSEENHGWRSGIQSRVASPWLPVTPEIEKDNLSL